jgi:hypothetical protein
VPDEQVCASTPSADLKPYDTEYTGYMGNYGNTMDRWYRRAAVVVWPRQHAFAARAEASPSWALTELRARLDAGDRRTPRGPAAALGAVVVLLLLVRWGTTLDISTGGHSIIAFVTFIGAFLAFVVFVDG